MDDFKRRLLLILTVLTLGTIGFFTPYVPLKIVLVFFCNSEHRIHSKGVYGKMDRILDFIRFTISYSDGECRSVSLYGGN